MAATGFRYLYGKPFEKSELPQKRLLDDPANGEGRQCAPHIGRKLDDLEKCDGVITDVMLADHPLADHQRVAHLVLSFQSCATAVDREGCCDRLQDGAEFIHTLSCAIEQRIVVRQSFFQRRRTVVRIKIRERGHAKDFSGRDADQDGGTALGLVQFDSAFKPVMEDCLNAAIDGEHHGRTALPELVLEMQLHAANADDLGSPDLHAVRSDTANYVGKNIPEWINPYQTLTEHEAGQPEILHRLLLVREHALLDPHELIAGTKRFLKFRGVKAQHLRQGPGGGGMVSHLKGPRVKRPG